MTHFNRTSTIVLAALVTLSLSASGDQPPDVLESNGDANNAMAASGGIVVRAATPDKLIAAMLAAKTTGQPTTILLAPGRYRFSRTFESSFGPSALPPVSTTITLIGRDSATTIFERSESGGRFLTVKRAGNLTVRGVTMLGGVAFCRASHPNNPCEQRGGGAVVNIGGTVRLQDCVLTGNEAYEEQGQGAAPGGAILSTGGHLYLDRTTVSGNQAMRNGGGIALTGGTARIRDSVISGNGTRTSAGSRGSTFGGGIYVTSGRLSIISSTVAGNVSNNDDVYWHGFGGGIHNGGGWVFLQRSAVTENVQFGIAGSGGGIFNGGTMVIENSTVGGNSAVTLGGGIFNGGDLTLHGVTVVHNDVLGRFIDDIDFSPYPPGCHHTSDGLSEECISSGGGLHNEPSATLRVVASVIAGNEFEFGQSPRAKGPDCYGVLISEGHNALGVDTDCELQSSPTLHQPTNDQVNLDPRIGDLEDNGQAGNGHYPPLADSPLIDTGGEACSPRDQLNHGRKDGDGDGNVQCDVGAIEFRKR
jgi:hypothetical protein